MECLLDFQGQQGVRQIGTGIYENEIQEKGPA